MPSPVNQIWFQCSNFIILRTPSFLSYYYGGKIPAIIRADNCNWHVTNWFASELIRWGGGWSVLHSETSFQRQRRSPVAVSVIGELIYEKYLIQKYKKTLAWSRGGLCVGDLPTLLWAGVRPRLVGQCGPSVTVLVNLSWILIASSIINYWWHSSNPRPQPQCKSDSSSSRLSRLPSQFLSSQEADVLNCWHFIIWYWLSLFIGTIR